MSVFTWHRSHSAAGNRRKAHTKSANRLKIERLEDRCLLSSDMVVTWCNYMLQAEALDYDPAVVAKPDQPGPTNTSRAFAIVSAGVYDAVNSIDGSYTPYLAKVPNAFGASIDAAAAQAAHDTLVAMFPHQQATFDQELATSLATIPPGFARRRGIEVGRQAAANILAARANDGSGGTQSYVPIPYPGYHQVDPLHPNQGFLSPQWGEVRPFALDSSNQFRAADVGMDPTSRLAYLNSAQYTADYNEVMSLGAKDSTTRTADQTEIGIFWAYDGSPDIGTPPRLFDQVLETVSAVEGNTEVQNARLFALVNLGMGDAAIACWESKYFYNFWRPIVGIRNADSTGNQNTIQDPNWEPLGAQADNNSGTNFTPNFPSYVSGHATFASTMFQILREFYGTDSINFSFQSDEYNGVTRDDTGMVRPPETRSYTSFTQPELEVHDSRIYLGVHWRFDQDQGMQMGRSVGDFVFNHILKPVHQNDTSTGTLVAPDPVPAIGGGAGSVTQSLLPATNGTTAAPAAPALITPANAGSSTMQIGAVGTDTTGSSSSSAALVVTPGSTALDGGLSDPTLGDVLV